MHGPGVVIVTTPEPVELLSLPDLAEALIDAAGLLDQVVEQLATHRRGATFAGDLVELHTIEDTAARAWAAAREAHTALSARINKEKS